MFKKLLTIGGVILFSIIFIGMTRQMLTVLQASYRLDKATEDVTQLQRQNNILQARLKQVSGVDFIEQQARDKLNMARPGETVVIMGTPQNQQIIQGPQPQDFLSQIPNWQGWLNLFFH